MSDNITNKTDLVFKHIFKAPVALVWRTWTDPALIMKWWGPDMFTCPSAKIDLRVGGTSIICMRAPASFGGQDMYSTWAYTQIIPLQKLEFIHNLTDEQGNKIDPSVIGMPPDFPQDQHQVVAFKDLGDGTTELTVTQFGWLPGHMMKMAKMGMEKSLVKIEKSLVGG